MIVAVLEVTVFLAEAQSLKDKRSIVQSVVRRCRNTANAAVAEVDGQDFWQRATLAAAVIGGDQAHAERQLQNILALIEREPRLEVIAVEREFY